jgi:hypothetical protein
MKPRDGLNVAMKRKFHTAVGIRNLAFKHMVLHIIHASRLIYKDSTLKHASTASSAVLFQYQVCQLSDNYMRNIGSTTD